MMKKTIFALLLMVVIFSTSALADNCGGTRRCHCGDWLVESQTMWYDLINCSEEGLRITTDNITLDCDDHLIDGIRTYYSGGISFVGASGVIVTNCNVQEFYHGIFTWKDSSNNLLLSNNASNNQVTGIYIGQMSVNNVLLDNIVSYNGEIGIRLYSEADGNVVFDNTVNNNDDEGIRVSSSNNNIWNNAFVNNGINAVDDESSNNWNVSDMGNFWSDFSSNPGYPDYYEILGSGNGIDWHPSSVEFYVDNSDEEFIILSGEWNLRHHYNAYNNEALYNNPGFGLERAGWKVNNLVFSGTYEVYVWKFEHEYLSRMGTNVHYMVYHRTGTSNWIIVNQQTPGNEWIYLGEFEFDNSHGQGVMITDEANGFVIADAIKLIYTGPLSEGESVGVDMFDYEYFK